MGYGLKIFVKPQLVTTVLIKIVKQESVTVVFRIFLKPQLLWFYSYYDKK